MKYTKLAATLLCSVVLLCGCAKKSDVVLKVNDETVTSIKSMENNLEETLKKSSQIANTANEVTSQIQTQSSTLETISDKALAEYERSFPAQFFLHKNKKP